jgi:glycosyltransferase involved in cell wall biosynthesis
MSLKLSILMPSHRADSRALARILELSDLDPERFEVIVRDNSGNVGKRRFCQDRCSKALKYIPVSPCSGLDQITALLELASGDAILWLGDDDFISTDGLISAYAAASDCLPDPGYGGVTWQYAILGGGEGNSPIIKYPDLTCEDPNERLRRFLSVRQGNYIYYSILKRSLVNLSFNAIFSRKRPYIFGHSDVLCSLIHVAHSKIHQINELVFAYNNSNWLTQRAARETNERHYVGTGLPPEVNNLHYLILGIEGYLTLKSNLLRYSQVVVNDDVANLWLHDQVRSFVLKPREEGPLQSAISDQALKIRSQLRAGMSFTPAAIFNEVAKALKLEGESTPTNYENYWRTL